MGKKGNKRRPLSDLSLGSINSYRYRCERDKDHVPTYVHESWCDKNCDLTCNPHEGIQRAKEIAEWEANPNNKIRDHKKYSQYRKNKGMSEKAIDILAAQMVNSWKDRLHSEHSI